MKRALKFLNDRYAALPDAEKGKSIFEIAPRPPTDERNTVTELWDRHWPTWRTPREVRRQDLKEQTAWWQERIADMEKILESGDDALLPSDHPLDAIVRKRSARKRKGSWWRVPEALRGQGKQPKPANEGGEPDGVQFHNGASEENVIDQEISVYVREDKPNISCLPQCRTFIKDDALWVDCAPPLNRKYVAPISNHAMISRSADDGAFAVFEQAASVLGTLVLKLFKMREEYDERHGSSDS